MCGNNKNCGCKRADHWRGDEDEHSHEHRHEHRCGCGCGRLWDSNSVCGSNIPCILNSYRLNKGTKEKYIYHYHLLRPYGDYYRNWNW